MTPLPEILVAVPLSDSVVAEFHASFIAAVNLAPDGSQGMAHVHQSKWGNIVNKRNEFVREVLDGTFTHLFFMDSDMRFPTATLSRLLSHNKDVVGGFYLRKTPPFLSTVFVEGESAPWHTLVPEPTSGLVKVTAVGSGCLLIRRQVLERLTWPWFSYEASPDGWEEFITEDVSFCLKAQRFGFEVWCDTSIRCGHVGRSVVTPVTMNGELKVKVDAV